MKTKIVALAFVAGFLGSVAFAHEPLAAASEAMGQFAAPEPGNVKAASGAAARLAITWTPTIAQGRSSDLAVIFRHQSAAEPRVAAEAARELALPSNHNLLIPNNSPRLVFAATPVAAQTGDNFQQIQWYPSVSLRF